MIFRASFSLFAAFWAALSLLLTVPACREKEEPKPKSKAKSTKTAAKPVVVVQHDAPQDDLSKRLETFTGGHSRLVWCQSQKKGSSDTFATSELLVLRGLDTRDGLGDRVLLDKKGNYSRPLLTTDGTGILFTDKNTVRKGGKKHYKPMIYRTDWKSSTPVKLAEGYATDCWRDPSTGVEWVYAVRDLRATKGLSLEGERLVRFRLDDPAKEELLYDDTLITPDNLQISRDGTRASGQFPWPHAGILRLMDGKWEAKKLLNGCWAGAAPDNSGVSWVFDGEHKSVTMFAEDGAKSWPLKFNNAPNVKNREMYHPRWSNHPRFFVITGPYVKEKNSSGNVINKGGHTAQIYLGRLSPAADKVEDWFQVNSDKEGDAYPDLWIAGAETASLTGYSIPQTSQARLTAGAWPSLSEGLLLLWRDREALNGFRNRSGQKLETRVESGGAGRFGRHNQLHLDAGTFRLDEDTSAGALAHLASPAAATFEALVLPPQFEGTGTPSTTGQIFSGPGFSVGMDSGRLVLAQAAGSPVTTASALPVKPYHLMVVRQPGAFTVFVNGQSVALDGPAPSTVPPAPASDAIVFGGAGWSGGILNAALYDRAATPPEAAANAVAARSRVAAFAPQPPRLKLTAKLAEVSAMPTPEGIEPYTGAMAVYIYDVEKVLDGTYMEKRILVKHWAMLGLQPVQDLPREVGRSYELIVEREADHAHLKGERVMDDTDAFDMEPWFDVTAPKVTAP